MLDKENFNSRELVSKLLPPVNYNKKAGFYNSDYSDFIKQGYDRVKSLMLDPEQLPKVQACTLESQSCNCVFKTLNALLK